MRPGLVLSEAGNERVNAANRLILADKIMASQNRKLEEARKKLQQKNSNPAAERYEEAPAQSTKASQTDLAEKFQQQLLKAQKDLELTSC